MTISLKTADRAAVLSRVLLCLQRRVQLQEHVELHLDSAAQGESQFQCPMCSVVCSDSFTLQEHVELHLDPGVSGNMSPGSDLKLARRLQEEEEQRRKEEEARIEKEQFKKLQKQFGLDGGGGYRKQMEQKLEKAVARGLMNPAEFHCRRAQMMETLASGQDDGKTRTQGVVKALSEFYESEAKDVAHVWLCADTDHFCSSDGDRGWGCGYRNFQMLLSSLLRLDQYSDVLTDMAVPSIPRVQALIEKAWAEGLDPHGASHFRNKLQGTRAWIGATEIYSLLTSLRVRARVVDFHQPTGPADTHPRLFEWIKHYFSHNGSSRLSPRINRTDRPPLYLQHQGHSRSVVGLEQRRSGALCLLILDPGISPQTSGESSGRTRLLRSETDPQVPSGLKHKQYQLVAAEGVLSQQDKQTSILKSKTFRAERIPFTETMPVGRSPNLLLHRGFVMIQGTHLPQEVDQIQDLDLRDSDVFVATYPKSGTIWLQHILLLLQSKGDVDLMSNKDKLSNGDLVPWIEVNGQIQEFATAESPRFRVTHLPFHLMPTALSRKKGKVIYVARNPKDILVSFYYFHKLATMLETPRSFDDFFEKFIKGEVMGGRWFEHIKSWFSHKDDINMLFITYEEMILDLTSVIKRIADFVDTELTQDQLQNVVKHSTFKNMRKIPQANYEQVPGDLLDHHEGTFMRKGTIGDWKNHFTVAQSEKFDEIFKQEMKDFPVSFIWDIRDVL
ncbi:hypothetical protein WMY93_025517 [Mugilogobius chulae]|uniref:Zinc finger-containing ubiquitin peptidase 1 n=1 Tax=Mugilogobius chulae TaxID=88201 RepID=A0AAW0N572_9GOBI